MSNATASAHLWSARRLLALASRPVVWFSLIAWAIVLLATLRVSEADIWYHLRNAQHFVTTASVVRADNLTFTSVGNPVIDYEWLSELPFYFAFAANGIRGLVVVYATLLIAIFAAAYFLALRRGASYWAAALCTTFGVALGSYSFGPRMMHFGWLCFAALLLVLDVAERRFMVLWAMPPLFAIWINLHGSWLFGFVAVAATLSGALVRGRAGLFQSEEWSTARIRTFGATTALSMLALFLNPYGYRLVWYPFDLLLRQQANLQTVIEWQSVNFQSGYGALALVMMLALVAVALLSRSPWKLGDVMLSAFAVWTALTHVRFLIFAAIVLIPVVAPRITRLPRPRESKNRPALNWLFFAAMLLIMARTIPAERDLERHVASDFPRAALEFMQQNGIGGRLFNAYDFGGFIEWYAPSLKTFADGRTDLFVYNGVFQDYLDIVLLRQSLELLDKYNIQHVLYYPGGQLVYLLEHSPSWRLIYSDNVARLYERVPAAR